MSRQADDGRLSRPGISCWRTEQAERLAFLIDGESYFAALATACATATRTIVILGWDVDARARVNRVVENLPEELGAFLDALTRRRHGLRVRVLAWDGSVFFGVERRLLQMFGLGRRVDYQLDGQSPFSACHHQKIVVIDGRLAFVGGIDVTSGRWDTRDHVQRDARRIEAGRAHGPYHDVQAVVDGPAAAALGELARERWRRATGRTIRSGLRQRARLGMRRLAGLREKAAPDPWPDLVVPAARDVAVSIARTEAQVAGRVDVREIEQIYLAAIASARRSIFIESQYFTSQAIGDAITRRLGEADGPEVLVVQPQHSSGWLEETTMGVRRSVLLRELRAADRHGRLRVVAPRIEGDETLHVHSKVLVVDDRIAHVGSANVSSRSFTLDTECGLTIESAGRADVAGAISALRNDLLAEHLGTTRDVVAAAMASHGSLLRALDALPPGPRRLEPLPQDEPGWLEALAPALSALDPERPAQPGSLRRELARARSARWTPWAMARGALVVALLLVLPFAWAWTPGGPAEGVNAMAEFLAPIRDSVVGPLVVIVAFVVAGLVAFPISLVVLATLLAYGPIAGSLLAAVATMISAFTGYVVGRVAGRPILRRLGGRAVDRLGHALERWGLLACAALRVVPIAPFTLVNLIAGTSGVRSFDFIAGTLLGVVPGVIAAAVFSDAVTHPGHRSMLALGAALVIVAAAWIWARWRWAGVVRG